MNWPYLFIPAAGCLVLVLLGAVSSVTAALLLNKNKRSRAAVLTDRDPPSPPASQADTRTRSLRAMVCSTAGVGLILLLTGLAGLWATRFSIGWMPRSPREWSDHRAPELEPLIRKHCVPFVRAGKSIGLAVAVVTPSNATVMAFGGPSLSAGEPVRADTVFELGSITKTFTGLALAREIERGSVRLEQPVQELLPAGVELPEPARAITLRHLTSHASGFPRMPADWPLARGLKMLLFGSDPYAGYLEAHLLADARKVQLEFKPGTKSSYSNFGMILLGHLLARKAGVSYEALVQRDVCQPLAMTDTTVRLGPAQATRAARGHRAVMPCGRLVFGLSSVPFGPDSGGAGALRSTAADMLKYLQANMHPENQPLESALRESKRELSREDERTAFGMNWILVKSKRLNQMVICHNGQTAGFSSFIGFTADRRVGVVILSNTSESVDDLSGGVLLDLANWASQGRAAE